MATVARKVEEEAKEILGAMVQVGSAANLPAFISQEFDDWDDDVVSTSKDFIVPRLQLMQGGSDPVKEGNANPGEYRDNMGNTLAGKQEELEVICFKRDKYWSVSEVDDKGQKVKGGIWRKEPFTIDNQDAEWNFIEDDKFMKRTLTYDFFVLQANEDGEKVYDQLPKVFSLSSSATRAAKDWYTKFTNLKTAKKLPISVVFKLGRKIEKKDSNSWLVPVISIGRDTTRKEQECAAYWRAEFAHKDVKVHEEA